MSIRLRFEKGSLSTQVTLNDEALPALLNIISEHQSDEVSHVTRIEAGEKSITDLQDNSKEPDRLQFTQAWLKQRSASEILSQITWGTFPEKILLLGAHHEAKGGGEGWKSADIEAQFKAAREQTPGNFARDISNAIKTGIIATVTPRTYRVSKTGWMKLYEALIKSNAEEAQPKV